MAGIRRLLHRRRHRRRRRRGCACSQASVLCCHQAPAAQPLGCCMRLGMPRGIVHAGRLRAATVAPRRLAVARNRSQHARRPTSQASHFARIAGNGRTTAGSNAPGGVDGVHGRGPPRHEDFLRHLGYLCFAGLCALPSRVSRFQRLHLIRTPKEHRAGVSCSRGRASSWKDQASGPSEG